MRSKRFLLAVAALATAMWAADARAQTIAYRNLLQFDLQSFRSQATGGVFYDDVDNLGDAARLLEVNGTRLYTNFSNLSDPATLGDNLITYSLDQVGGQSSDPFDSGTFLGGWIGKYDQDSDYTFSVVIQRSGYKMMFEDLEDGNLGSSFGSDDAEYVGTTLQGFDDGTGETLPAGAGDGDVDREIESNSDLMRFDERSSARFDIAAARELNGTDWSIGGRVFWNSDKIERNAEGTTTTESREKTTDDGPLDLVTSRSSAVYSGSMEDAFKMREAGVSVNGDWHPGGWSLNTRVDVFGINYTNPSSGTISPTSRGKSFTNVPDLAEFVNETWQDPNNNGSDGVLSANNLFRTSFFTDSFGSGYYRGGFGLATERVDDERTGVGVAAKLELDRAAWGGDTRTWVGINHRPMDIDANIVMVERSGDTFWWNDGTNGDLMATTTNIDSEVTLNWTGDASNTVLEAGGRWWRALSNRVEMGAGVTVTRSRYDQTFRETASESTIQNAFDDGSGSLGDNLYDTFQGGGGTYNEQETLVESTRITDFDDETTQTDVRIPIGAQFNVTKKIKWQMGVQHKITDWKRELTRATAASDAGQVATTVTDHAAGTTVTTYSTGTQNSGNETITDRDEYNITTYWYGIEWLVGDTAQFNINGFFDSYSTDSSPTFHDTSADILDVDFFRNLAVSLTFLFD